MAVTKRKSNRSASRRFSKLLAQLLQRMLGSLRLTPSKSRSKAYPQSASLRSLTMAALALPGLIATPTYAGENDEIDLQYGHYQEGSRDISGVDGEKIKSKFHPIESHSMHGSGKITLTDRLKGVINYSQDTWSGATPIATAPREFRGNKPTSIDGISGATPYLLNSGSVYLDPNRKPLKSDGYGNLSGGIDDKLVHTLSGASPETRKQIDLQLIHEWDEAALNFGGGVSYENDYLSKFGNIGGRWDFNQKLTSLNVGLSYTKSTTKAILDHDASPYIYNACGNATCNYISSVSHIETKDNGNFILHGKREDWGAYVGATQVLNKNAQIETSIGYTRSTGYLSNPYKVVEVAFIDPDQQFLPTDAPIGSVQVQVNSLLENRPEERNQGTLDVRYVQHIETTDAALHLNYRYYQDDWNIKAHTLEADWAQPLGNGWTVTPRIRYYSQEAADFYTPFIVTNQALTPNVIDPVKGQAYVDWNTPNGPIYFDDPTLATPDGYNPYTGNPVVDVNGNPVSQAIADNLMKKQVQFDRKKLPTHYSSDHRLSGYGALSGGLTVSKQFSKAVRLDVGYEYYKHGGSLKLGGGGEGSYADFNYHMLNAALKIDLNAAGYASGSNDDGYNRLANHGEYSQHHDHGLHASHAPAGVMFDHMLPYAGDFMVGYRYMYGRQDGSMLHGSNSVSDQKIVNQGCSGKPCYITPSEMNMHMHMLDIMYAPTDWLNLMLMPTFVDMNMNMRELDGAPKLYDTVDSLGQPINPNFDEFHLIQHHILHEHTTGSLGDTGIYGLFKLYDAPGQHLHAALGFTIPTGDVDIKLRRTHQVEAGFTHYGMQLGSGTWDFKPSVTYLADAGKWSFGTQINGTKRLENENKSGFAFGDEIQATTWGSYHLLNGLSASLRGVYTAKGKIKGKYDDTFNSLGPMDYKNNYGGRFWDVGLGLNLTMPEGSLAGNRLSIEWLQPVNDDVNGYQLDRKGSLALNWSMMF